MKILYLVTQSELGGAQKYVVEMAEYFHGEVATSNSGAYVFEECAKKNIPCHTLKNLTRSIHPIKDLLCLFEIWKLLKTSKADILHTNSSKAGVLGSVAGFLAGVPVVYTAHGWVFLEPLPKWQRLSYLAMERIGSMFRTFTITVSEKDFQAGIEKGMGNEKNSLYIPIGIKHLQFLERFDAKKQLSLEDSSVVFGTIANAYLTKGLDILLTAFSELSLETRKLFKWVLLGGGPELENLKSLSEKLGLNDIVSFLGPVNEASKYLKAFDWFVLPSRKEGLPYTILEAMQANVPIIATNVGGIPKVLTGSKGVCEPTVSDLKAQISRALNDPSFKENCLETASINLPDYTFENTVSKTAKVYSDILKTTH